MDKQKELLQLQILEQEANQYGEQLKIVEQQIREMNSLKKDIQYIGDSGSKDIFSGIGKGIYVRGKLEKSDLLVEVGSNVFVPKNGKEVEKIIEDQVIKLKEAEKEIGARVEMINKQLNQIIGEVHNTEKPEVKKKKK